MHSFNILFQPFRKPNAVNKMVTEEVLSIATSVWDYFTKLSESRVQCNICDIGLPLVQGKTTGLQTHLQWAHKIILQVLEPKPETSVENVKQETISEKIDVKKEVVEEKPDIDDDECKFYKGKPADTIFHYLKSSLKGQKIDKTTDVSIFCKNGSVPAHKLVLASISPMLYAEFKENCFDETVSIIMNDFTVQEVKNYLKDVYNNQNLTKYTSINVSLGFRKEVNFARTDCKGTQTTFVEKSAKNGNGNHEEDMKLEDKYFKDFDIFDDGDVEPLDCDNADDGPVKISFKTVQLPVARAGGGGQGSGRSFVWDHFVKNDQEKRTCIHCGLELFVQRASTWKLRDHVISAHKDKISEELKDDLMKNSNIDVDNYKPGAWNSQDLPDEPVIDPETGEMLTKKDIRKKFRKKPEKKKEVDGVMEYFKVDPSDPTQNLCQLCLIAVDNQDHDRCSSEMLEHLQQAHELFKLLCSQCGLTFNDKAARNRHEASHKEESMKFICPYTDCSKPFAKQESLDRHIRVHTGEKPFVCNECGKGFRIKSHLTQHYLHKHSDDTPHQCNFCHERFKFAATKKKHKCYATDSPMYETNDLDFHHY